MTIPTPVDPPAHSPPNLFSGLQSVIHFLLATGLAAFLIEVGWQKWADVLGDYGQQLYIPWQISEGQILYRDLPYTEGPLSQYIHAWIFQIWGPGVLHLALFNIVLIGLMAFLTYRIFSKLFSATAGFLTTLAFIALYAFGHQTSAGSFNFVAPYLYEDTHGVFLGLLTFHAWQKYLEDQHPLQLLGIGLLFGAIFMVKAEVFVATLGSIGIVLVTEIIRGTSSSKNIFLKSLLFFTSGLLIPGLFLLYFSVTMPLSEAWEVFIRPWMLYFGSNSGPVFKHYQYPTGIADPFPFLFQLLGFSQVFLILICTTLWVSHRWCHRMSPSKSYGTGVIVSLILCVLFFLQIPWLELIRPLPLFVLIFALWQVKQVRQAMATGKNIKSNLSLLVFSIFSLLLAANNFWEVRVSGYGFTFGLPAVLLGFALIAQWLPSQFQNTHGETQFYFGAATTFMVLVLIVSTYASQIHYQRQRALFGSGPDAILGSSSYSPTLDKVAQFDARSIQDALHFLRTKTDQGTEVLVMPDSLMFNYLVRRRSGSQGLILNPKSLLKYNESDLVRLLESKQPKVVVLVGKAYVNEYPYYKKNFGLEFGVLVMDWVHRNYSVWKQFGDIPFQHEGGFGIQILKRNS